MTSRLNVFTVSGRLLQPAKHGNVCVPTVTTGLHLYSYVGKAYQICWKACEPFLYLNHERIEKDDDEIVLPPVARFILT